MEKELHILFDKVINASRKLNITPQAKINEILVKVADAAVNCSDKILQANALDLKKMSPEDPMYDRLKLTEERIGAIAGDMRKVAGLPSPLGKVLSENIMPNGMKIKKISVPFGVIGIIYEARPNVTFDVFSLCLKSGSACILKGSANAHNSNCAIVEIIHDVLMEENADPNSVVLLPPDHAATSIMLNAVGKVDLIIPRGSKGLINFVRDNSRVPVIETGAGICHTYFHTSGDTAKGAAIIKNAKTRRVSVCNALDCLIIDRGRLEDLPSLVSGMADDNVIIYADKDAYAALEGKYQYLEHATGESWGCEYLDYKMSVKTVADMDEALGHIAVYSSKHSESIVAEDKSACERFGIEVDAACVYTNVSTAFTDGAQFGLGAEIGISTQKLHARGPMALSEITSYKYIIEGDGQVRNS
jgi:gamma-glutamyl phosphate reductase